MPQAIEFTVNGNSVSAREGQTVAAALANLGICASRRSVSGEPRGPLCGMGICFECEVTVDQKPHVRGCQLPVHQGMKVQTGA